MKYVVRIVALLLMLAIMTFLIPAATPMEIAIGEGLEGYPAYQPVTLEAVMVEPIPYDAKTPYAPSDAGWLPEKGGYLDDTISVRVETMRAYDSTIMLCWVQIADPSQLRAESTKPYPSKATAIGDVLAKRVDAVVAVNGDYFVHRKEGYVVRNGQELRGVERCDDRYDTLIIDEKGDMHIIQQPTAEKIEAFEGKIIHALSFGPGLVVDGELVQEFTMKECAPAKKTQRICLAQMGPLSYLIVATEGPENKGSTGLKLADFAQLVYDLGAQNAYNLDGGSSSTLVLDGKKINSLSTGKKRAIGDILYFVTAVPDTEVLSDD